MSPCVSDSTSTSAPRLVGLSEVSESLSALVTHLSPLLSSPLLSSPAGMLHGYKVPAIMSTYHTPSTYDLDVRDCAAGGLDFISPRSDIFLLNSRVENNLGAGLNILGK